MRVLDLFSGIGGFSLGLERAGMRTVAFCEIEPYCRAVLAKHWPGVPIYDDVRTLTRERLVADGTLPDLVCGGFPCQDISLAGRGAGIAGSRSGLWSEFARIIAETRPAWAIIENVSALRSRGLDTVLGSLAALGYDAEWHCIPASAVGAPHRRDRIWIIAYPQADAQCPDPDSQRPHRTPQHEQREAEFRDEQKCEPGSVGKVLAYAHQHPRNERRVGDTAEGARGRDVNRSTVGTDDVAHPLGPRLEGRARLAGHLAGQLAAVERGGAVPGANGQPAGRLAEPRRQRGQWLVEPPMGELVDGISGGLVRFAGRTATGIPNRIAKLRALGNAVVPQIPEAIGRAILAAEAAKRS